MRAPADPPGMPLPVTISTMKRKHVRDVLAVERQVYPRPWSAALFFSELSQKASRVYLVAEIEGEIIGYGGLMCHLDEGHITTLAVQPDFQHHQVGSKILYLLVADARERRVRTLALEVRVANWPAQRLYSWFGFRPVGIRRNYYAETGEDALVMWIDDMQSDEIGARLRRVRERIGAVTVQ
ncbi:MAG TPA: ribosomal protein S18-alanine N-acetyltransferase [Actinomycetota bacterium]